MRITGYESELSILKELGERIKQNRISRNLTQAELAEKCGISMSTQIRIENGDDSKISNIIKIMIALDLTDNINLIIPEVEPDYKAIFEEKPARKRVSKKKKASTSEWVWGEDK